MTNRDNSVIFPSILLGIVIGFCVGFYKRSDEMTKVEGIPDGWELVRIGFAKQDEWVVDDEGNLYQLKGDAVSCRPIVRKIEKPKRYRPFANAEEFKPYRDKWWYRDDQDGRVHFPPAAYCDKYHGGLTFVEKLNTCFFEDGAQFGIEVTDE